MAKKQTNTTSIGFEDAIWRAADKLRGNLNASEYEGVVLGLIFHAVSGKSIEEQIVNTACSQSGDNLKNILNSLRAKSPIKLSWTHYRIILQENTERGRVWYERRLRAKCGVHVLCR